MGLKTEIYDAKLKQKVLVPLHDTAVCLRTCGPVAPPKKDRGLFPLAITFDFDHTLIEYAYDDEYGFVHVGTNQEILAHLKEAKRAGCEVFIVTARRKGEEKNRPFSVSVKDWMHQEGVEVDGVYFTEGGLKAQTLLELGSILHYDDDPEEIYAAEHAGIPTVFVEA